MLSSLLNPIYSFPTSNQHRNTHTLQVSKESGIGVESERVKLKLTIVVEGVEFDPEGAGSHPYVLLGHVAGQVPKMLAKNKGGSHPKHPHA